jgi:hypothetical protein
METELHQDASSHLRRTPRRGILIGTVVALVFIGEVLYLLYIGRELLSTFAPVCCTPLPE